MTAMPASPPLPQPIDCVTLPAVQARPLFPVGAVQRTAWAVSVAGVVSVAARVVSCCMAVWVWTCDILRWSVVAVTVVAAPQQYPPSSIARTRRC